MKISTQLAQRLLLTALLPSFLIFSTSCVRDEEAETPPPSKLSALEEIKEQLNRPLIKAAPSKAPEEPTKASRWIGHNNATVRGLGKPTPENPVNAQRKLITEIYELQDQVSWPPEEGQPFPVMPLLSPTLEKRMTESFRGRVTLIEYAAMTSPVTQALAGSNDRGPYGAVAMSPSFKRLEQYFPDYSGGIQAGDINRVQILMTDLRSQIVSPALAQAWSEHFELESKHGRTVLIASAALLQGTGAELIGGFQLLDKNMIVRADATRTRSKTLFSVLFPLLPRLVR